MKKSRPGQLLRVIAAPEQREQMAGVIFAETPTLGLRFYSAERRVRARGFTEVQTAHGPVRIKTSENGAFAPEYEDCRAAARAQNVPLRDVITAATIAFLKMDR
jgi:uncharacterized protein (DUF111 family)